MGKGKTARNVVELAEQIGGDGGFSKGLAEHLHKRRLIDALAAMRAAKGLSQKDMAERMGCSQSRVSKMEAAEDASLNLGAVIEYVQAIGGRLDITLADVRSTAVDRVKHHAFCIMRETDRLAELALADPSIAEGVSSFFDEAAFNLLRMLERSAKKLPASASEAEPSMTVETCSMDDPEEAEAKRSEREERRSALVEA